MRVRSCNNKQKSVHLQGARCQAAGSACWQVRMTRSSIHTQQQAAKGSK
jgi:hypothetical protein